MKKPDGKIGERIKAIRGKLGISGAELGELLGVKRSAVSQYETGENSPSLKSLCILASLGEMTIDQLITGDNPEKATEISRDDAIKEALRAFISEDHQFLKEIKETISEYALPHGDPQEHRLLKIFRRLHPAERDKVLEIAQLYDGAKERCKNDGEVNSLKELKSGSK